MAQHRQAFSRRNFVQVGGLAALGLTLPELLSLRGAEMSPRAAKAKSCILIWLDGGPSHLETFDLKPDAPAEVRGPFRPLKTAVPGIEICDLMPGLAARIGQAAIVRSVTSPLGEHNLGAHYLLTGYPPTAALEYPAIGSVVAHLDPQTRTLPKHIAIPSFAVGGKRLSGNGYLPQAAQPFEIGGKAGKADFRVRDLELYPGLADDQLHRRRDYLAALERFSGQHDAPFEAAYRLIESAEAKAAFDLQREPAETRARYGHRAIGQSTLLARRLVEAGVPFITVNYPGWDTHQNLYTQLKEGYTGAKHPEGLIPSLDRALSSLLDDLQDRDLLGETLIVAMGEFGRTPKLNTQGGRDHWPRVFSVLLAGGGIPGGQVIGSSDATGESPRDQPVTPADLAATIYSLLGIDPQQLLHTADGRPVHISRDGRPIAALLG
ncbi:MAG: DUF1501 domain-containing protein [Pirellulaceae bacterium]